jgi:SAM-dependent methyltransferase
VEREDWNRRHEERGLHFAAEPSRFLIAEAAALEPGRALDLGCGSGRNAVWLAERGWAVTAVDFSDTALGQAHALAGARGVEVTWVEADLRDFVPEPGAFDLALVLYVHLPADERREVFARARSALAPQGTLLVVLHDLANRGRGAGGPSDPGVLCTADDVVRELPGLRVERAGTVLRPYVREDGVEVEAIDTLVRASAPA